MTSNQSTNQPITTDYTAPQQVLSVTMHAGRGRYVKQLSFFQSSELILNSTALPKINIRICQSTEM